MYFIKQRKKKRMAAKLQKMLKDGRLEKYLQKMSKKDNINREYMVCLAELFNNAVKGKDNNLASLIVANSNIYDLSFVESENGSLEDKSPLFECAWKANFDLAKQIIERDHGKSSAIISYPVGKDKITPLMRAAHPFTHGYSPEEAKAVHSEAFKIVKLLIEAGADVNAKTTRGLTALSFAQTNEMFELLVENGAKLTREDLDSYAGQFESCPIMKKLAQIYSDPSTFFELENDELSYLINNEDLKKTLKDTLGFATENFPKENAETFYENVEKRLKEIRDTSNEKVVDVDKTDQRTL